MESLCMMHMHTHLHYRLVIWMKRKQIIKKALNKTPYQLTWCNKYWPKLRPNSMAWIFFHHFVSKIIFKFCFKVLDQTQFQLNVFELNARNGKVNDEAIERAHLLWQLRLRIPVVIKILRKKSQIMQRKIKQSQILWKIRKL